jgi:hypothetical protein
MRRNRWSSCDRQAFADGNRLRASSIPGRRSSGPQVSDWDLNTVRVDGVDRCACGCKYWVDDRCIDCGDTEVVD